MKNYWIVFAVVVGLTSVGCTATRGKKGSVERPSSSANAGSSGSESGSASGSGVETDAPGSDSDADLAKRTVYFDLDKSDIQAESLPVVEAWAKYLVANASVKVRLEGHCDERGTREYNVALGERRGNSLREALASRGVGATQLSVVSFGEERPIALGHDDAAWSQNRRAEIILQ
ncbi:MAG: peptidoglycan-associated lipoprotein Pal [Pseudomonadota bacterium]